MSTGPAASLFDPPSAAVVPQAAQWIEAVLAGTLATSLCVLAVAWVGLSWMTGRLALRDGLRVAVACFVLLGAPAIAAGLLRTVSSVPADPPGPVVPATAPPAPLPPANYDPYAGASLRQQ